MNKSYIAEMPFFYDRYIHLLADDIDILEELKATKDVLQSIKEDLIANQDFAYAEGKWTPKDILQHLIDTERIMAYRALVLARGEQQALIGFEEDVYAKNTNATKRTIEDLMEEFALVRQTTILQFQQFTKEMMLNKGLCSGITVTPLILAFVCVGHVKHHLHVLKESYFHT